MRSLPHGRRAAGSRGISPATAPLPVQPLRGWPRLPLPTVLVSSPHPIFVSQGCPDTAPRTGTEPQRCQSSDPEAGRRTPGVGGAGSSPPRGSGTTESWGRTSSVHRTAGAWEGLKRRKRKTAERDKDGTGAPGSQSVRAELGPTALRGALASCCPGSGCAPPLPRDVWPCQDGGGRCPQGPRRVRVGLCPPPAATGPCTSGLRLSGRRAWGPGAESHPPGRTRTRHHCAHNSPRAPRRDMFEEPPRLCSPLLTTAHVTLTVPRFLRSGDKVILVLKIQPSY